LGRGATERFARYKRSGSVPDDRPEGSEILMFTGTTTIKPEHEEAYVAVTKATAEMIRRHEPDTLLHLSYRHPTEPHTYVFVERYRNADAVRAHAEAPYFREAMGKVQDWLAKPPDVLQLTEIVWDIQRAV
jgi:quinol monooxygenase YgiN